MHQLETGRRAARRQGGRRHAGPASRQIRAGRLQHPGRPHPSAVRRLRHRLRHGPVPARPCRAQAAPRQGGRAPARARRRRGTATPRRRWRRPDSPPTPFDASLGSIGGGNHFCELQAIEEIVEPEAAAQAGLDRACAPTCSCIPARAGSAMRSCSGSWRQAAARSPRGATPAAPIWRSTTARCAGPRSTGASSRRARRRRSGPMQAARRPQPQPRGVRQRRRPASQGHGALRPRAGADPGLARHAVVSGRAAGAGRPETLASLAHGAGRKYDRASMHGRVRTGKSRPGAARPQSVRRRSSSARTATCWSRKRRRPTRASTA